MSRFPRNTEMEDAQTFDDILHSITARAPHDWTWGHRWVWAEYSAHIGWGIVALSVVGVLFALERGRRHLIVGAIVFALCAMGNAGEYYPWPLLHELPLYENFHVPSRFHVLLTFYLCLLAGLAVERMLRRTTERTKRRWSRATIAAMAWVLFLGSAVEVLSNSTIIASRWDGNQIVGVAEPRFHLVTPMGYLEQYMNYPARNVGTRACYDPVPWVISPGLWQGDVAQARLVPPSAGEVTEWGRTNHTVFAVAHLEEPARLVFNQNFDPDWRVSVGEPVEDMARLAVDLPAGEHRVQAHFAPADLPWSVLTSVAGGLLALLLALFARPRRRSARRRRRSTSPPPLGNRGA